MKKKWTMERKWEKNPAETEFEHLLNENGFVVLGIREYVSKTEYLIEKDDFKCEYYVYHVDEKKSHGRTCYKNFVNYFKITKEHYKLMEAQAKAKEEQ